MSWHRQNKENMHYENSEFFPRATQPKISGHHAVSSIISFYGEFSDNEL